jgi:hypothetical protein
MDVQVFHAFVEEYQKLAAELTPETRAKIPGKEFAVSAKSSNTGAKAYPIDTRQRAVSALGFSKMHGDAKDIAEVRKDVAAKYPDLMKKKEGGVRETAVRLFDEHPKATAATAFGLGALAHAGEHQIHRQLAQHAQRKVEEERKKEASDAAELAGLGVLAVPGLDQLQAHARAAMAGDYNKGGVSKREFLPHVVHPLAETAGLGILAGPSAAKLLKSRV